MQVRGSSAPGSSEVNHAMLIDHCRWEITAAYLPIRKHHETP